MDILLPIGVVVVIVATVVYLFWIGKYGAWGNLSRRFPLDSRRVCIDSKSFKYESVAFLNNGKWEGNSWNWVLIYLEKDGVILLTKGIFKKLLPGMCIPWSRVNEVRKKSLYGLKNTELTLVGSDISILIPYRYLEQCRRMTRPEQN
jgi:hypothetical protein